MSGFFGGGGGAAAPVVAARINLNGTVVAGSVGITSVTPDGNGNYAIDFTAAGFTVVPIAIACGYNVSAAGAVLAMISSSAAITSTSCIVSTFVLPTALGSTRQSAFFLYVVQP